MQRTLTPHTTLDNLRREAKRWLNGLREGKPDAQERFRSAYPKHTGTPVLRDVQHAVAREYGFENWNELKLAVQQAARSRTRSRRAKFSGCPRAWPPPNELHE